MLDRVSTIVLGLDGQGRAESFADYAQWEQWQAERKQAGKRTGSAQPAPSPRPETQAKKKLSYLEAREYSGIEQRIAAAEQLLQARRAEMENPAIASDGPGLLAAHAALEAAQKDLEALYARWAELEEKAAVGGK
jgi:ATP-binding cassette subfamily F protein uup